LSEPNFHLCYVYVLCHLCKNYIVPFMVKNSKDKIPIYDSIWNVHHDYQMVIHVVNLILSTLSLIKFHLDQALKPYLFTSPKNQTWNLHSPLLCTSSSREGEESIFFFFQASYKCSRVFFPQSFGKRLLIFILLIPHHFCAKLSFLVPNFFLHPLKLGSIQIWVLGSSKHFHASFIKVEGSFHFLNPNLVVFGS